MNYVYSKLFKSISNSLYIEDVSNPSCEVCGFTWNDVTFDEIPTRLEAAVSGFCDVLLTSGENAGRRPSPERWSVLEYSAHLRDVLISLRDRIIAGALIDNAVGSPIYRDERVDRGFYQNDLASELVVELEVARRLLAKTFLALDQSDLARVFTYSPVSSMKVTIMWTLAQAVHESEHHLNDVKENLRLLNTSQ